MEKDGEGQMAKGTHQGCHSRDSLKGRHSSVIGELERMKALRNVRVDLRANCRHLCLNFLPCFFRKESYKGENYNVINFGKSENAELKVYRL